MTLQLYIYIYIDVSSRDLIFFYRDNIQRHYECYLSGQDDEGEDCDYDERRRLSYQIIEHPSKGVSDEDTRGNATKNCTHDLGPLRLVVVDLCSVAGWQNKY
jgi:hypothetical protein